MSQPRILVVDDEKKNLLILESLLEPAGMQVEYAAHGKEALERVAARPPDLVLLDVMLPDLDGFTVCRRLKSNEATRLIPIILVTALNEIADRVRAFDSDADDFLTKPVNRHELLARVRSCLRIKILNDRLESSESVLFAFAAAVEAKDPYTIGHSERVARFAVELATRAGLTREVLADVRRGGLLHDIGKIGVPDAVLRKEGKLTPEEFHVIQRHTIIGERICYPLRSFSGLLPLVRSHHERLDGSGYPDALAGDAISTPVRVLSIADCFDAISSDRPYRPRMPLPELERILGQEAQRGRLDAALVELAQPCFPQWYEVCKTAAATPGATAEAEIFGWNA